MNSYRSLQCLLADDTKLVSFKGAVPQNNLSQISAKRSPLGGSPYFPLMSLIAFGSDIVVVNGQSVTDGQKERARKLRPLLQGLLKEGWIILNLSPLVLMDPVTRKRRRVYTPISETIGESDQVVIVHEEESPVKANQPAPTQSEEDVAMKQLRARFNRFQRNFEDNIVKRSGSPLRCRSRQADNTLRNSMRPPLSPERRCVSPLQNRPFDE